VTGGLAGVLGAALVDADGADPEADGEALEAERLGDAAADGFGAAAWPGVRADRGPCGTVAVAMPMGLASAQAPARAESHAPAVCSAVTVPGTGGAAAEPGPRVR